jgi:RNA recognition motif-containing protein
MNIYIGNLNYKIDENELKNVFSEFGTVDSVKIIYDKYSNRSKGFGFIEMPNDDEGNKAIESLNGKELSGRTMVVNLARKRIEN